jgi:hypothetical protein
MDEIILTDGIRHATIPATPAVILKRADVLAVATEACSSREAFHLVFIHADTGGRALEQGLADRSLAYCEAMHALCGLNPTRCITIAPRHETEAWILCDPSAVTGALGYNGDPADIGLPINAAAAEGLADPKSALHVAMRGVRGRRRPENPATLYPAIAQRQGFGALRASQSFGAFETELRAALASLGCI